MLSKPLFLTPYLLFGVYESSSAITRGPNVLESQKLVWGHNWWRRSYRSISAIMWDHLLAFRLISFQWSSSCLLNNIVSRRMCLTRSSRSLLNEHLRLMASVPVITIWLVDCKVSYSTAYSTSGPVIPLWSSSKNDSQHLLPHCRRTLSLSLFLFSAFQICTNSFSSTTTIPLHLRSQRTIQTPSTRLQSVSVTRESSSPPLPLWLSVWAFAYTVKPALLTRPPDQRTSDNNFSSTLSFNDIISSQTQPRWWPQKRVRTFRQWSNLFDDPKVLVTMAWLTLCLPKSTGLGPVKSATASNSKVS